MDCCYSEAESFSFAVACIPSDQAGPFVLEAAARAERPAIWLQTGIRADAEVESVRATGTLVVQDMCTFRVHRALFS